MKFLSYLAVSLIGYSFLMFSGAIQLKPSEYFTIGNGIENADNAYRGIFGQGLWIIIGSMVAFLIGQVLDVLVFHRIKKMTGEKRIWLRATGSTLVSQLVDSFVVLFIAFYVGRRLQSNQENPGACTRYWLQVPATTFINLLQLYYLRRLSTSFMAGLKNTSVIHWRRK